MAPIQLFFNDFYWSIGIHHADQQEIDIARVVGPLIGPAYLGLIGFGLFAGIPRRCRWPGARTTRRRCHSAGSWSAGSNIILWIGLTHHLCAILGMFL